MSPSFDINPEWSQLSILDMIESLVNTLSEPCCGEKAVCCDVASTINSRLETQKKRLELQLAETNAAIEALNKHPEVANVLNLVGKAVGRL